VKEAPKIIETMLLGADDLSFKIGNIHVNKFVFRPNC